VKAATPVSAPAHPFVLAAILAFLFAILTFFTLSPPPAQAGPNAGGTLIVHSAGTAMVGSVEICTEGTTPTGYDSVVDREDVESADAPAIFRIYAIFPSTNSPRLMGLTWGVTYDPSKLILAASDGCDNLSFPDTGWPDPGTGTSVVYSTPQTAQVVRVYAFSAYTVGGQACTFDLTSNPNPTQGGYFGDDSVPAVLDPIAGFGGLGFHQDGHVPWEEIPRGACCTPDDLCTYAPESDCPSPAVWVGAWTNCEPDPCGTPLLRACCGTDGSCTLTTEDACSPPSLWHAEWSNCWSNPCPLPPMGACCHPDGTCIRGHESDCASPGVWHQEWAACSPNPCPQPSGACCFAEGSCFYLPHNQCSADWRGLGTTCSPNPCPQPSAPGACCLRSGGCNLLSDLACTVAQGVFQGVGTVCYPDPCVWPGACCDFATGNCTLTLQADCPYQWQGAGVPCSIEYCPVSAPVGACCDYPTAICTMTSESQCGFTWLGVGSVCNIQTCPPPSPPTGACCRMETGACSVTTQSDCSFIWMGVGTTCNSTTCPVPVPVLHKTWGQIKASYR
jgi:hypothetical protein